MRIWSILSIKSDLKWCIHLSSSKSLFEIGKSIWQVYQRFHLKEYSLKYQSSRIKKNEFECLDSRVHLIYKDTFYAVEILIPPLTGSGLKLIFYVLYRRWEIILGFLFDICNMCVCLIGDVPSLGKQTIYFWKILINNLRLLDI